MKKSVKYLLVSILLNVMSLFVLPNEVWGFYEDNISKDIPISIDVVVNPIVKTRWNFNGIVNDLAFQTKDGLPYYNHYLPFIETVNFPDFGSTPFQKIPLARRAAVGCVNLAMGQIMYMHGSW